MKLTVVLAAALVAAPALQATEKTGVMKPKAAPYWVKIDSIETPQPGQVECFTIGTSVPPKPSQTVNVHISYNVPPDATVSARFDAAAVGEAAPSGRGVIPVVPKGSSKAVIPAYFHCPCPAGKSTFTIERVQAVMQVAYGAKISSLVLPAHLIVDCPATGPMVQGPPPTPDLTPRSSSPTPIPPPPPSVLQKKN
jgi:hypothetical protein